MYVHSYYDKEDWPDGDWKTEPDAIYFVDTETFFPCVINRTLFGTLTGWVGLPPQHPYYQVVAARSEIKGLECHNGVTMTTWNVSFDKQSHPGIRRWWVGFDCMGENDMVPRPSSSYRPKRGRSYKKVSFVQEELKLLSHQLFEVMKKKALANPSKR